MSDVKLPVIPATCGECDAFERWNDGSCLLAEDTGELVNAERLEPPPENCPKRHPCPTCGRVGGART